MNQKIDPKANPKADEKPQREDPKELTKAPEGAAPSGGARPSEDRVTKTLVDSITSIRVKISKDTAVMTKRVYEHEIIVLQMLFGEEKVEVVEGSEDETPVGTATEEYDRLMRVYGKKGAKVVREVYPSAAALAADTGLSRPKVKATKAGMELKEQSKQRGKGVK